MPTLSLPGATLHCKKQGDGPLLLILQGGDGNADSSRAIASRLAHNYTVLTYDRRGLSRSTPDLPPGGITIGTHADDAHLLLEALTAEPALVLGMSIGAMIGLELISRHASQVRRLICHEPPATELLPDDKGAAAARAQADVEATFSEEGVLPAMKRFAVLAGLDFSDKEPGVELPQSGPDRIPNLTFFLRHDAPAVRLHRFDFTKLEAVKNRIVPGVGRTSANGFAHQCAALLAARLGVPTAEFPGGHAGFATHPQAFAEKVREVFGPGTDTDQPMVR